VGGVSLKMGASGGESIERASCEWLMIRLQKAEEAMAKMKFKREP
jgi:hypothetical protein